MEKRLYIKPGLDTPKIDFNAETGELLIEGKSFPPDVTSFYKVALSWLDEYAKNPAEKTTLKLKLDYFNTASSKILLDILYRMEDLYKNGYDVIIKWFYPEDDEDMKETGIEYSEIIKVPFDHISYTYMFED